MNLVEPIRDKKKIQDLKVYLKGRNVRDHALFVVGINVALRISDLLKLTWKDVLNEKGKGFKSIKVFAILLWYSFGRCGSILNRLFASIISRR
jgi:hypothetical protein